MCGICGYWNIGTSADLSLMLSRIVHRGPDAEGRWHDEASSVSLGHRRLSILDIGGGAQPMFSADEQLVIVFNGEIYNHCELRLELEQKGHRFLSDHSDTEVLLYAYREWGTSFVTRLNGMWAFALFDRPKNRLFLSRDRFGKKPLYYYSGNNGFAFASELTALTAHSKVPARTSSLSLAKYFAYGYVPAPHSLYEYIKKLRGGYNLELNLQTGHLTNLPYWSFELDPFRTIPKNPEEEWGAAIREKLALAVKRRLISDVPIGVFLSGGIDSSAICHYATQAMPGIKSFNIGFDEASFDESSYAKAFAQSCGSDYVCERMNVDRMNELLPAILEKLDEPFADSSILPTYLLCGIARKGVTVALGGDGSDELFAGYDPFRAIVPASLYDKFVPTGVHGFIETIANKLPVSHRNMSFDFKLKRTLRGLGFPPVFRNAVWLGPLNPNEIKEAFAQDWDPEELYSEAIEAWDAPAPDSFLDRTLQFYTRLYLQDDIMTKVDRVSMMHSLEVRSPFLDIELVDFVRRIPSSYKLRNGTTKYILKKALEPVLPHTTLYRKKKGFGVPIGKWFREGKLTCSGSPENNKNPFQVFLKRYESEHRNGIADHRLFLFASLVLQQFNVK